MLFHHLKPRQYDSPFFIELSYPRDTAEQYLVSATHVHLKMSLSVTHPLHRAFPKTAYSYINSFCAIVQALPTRKTSLPPFLL